jgi:hypothetical protein
MSLTASTYKPSCVSCGGGGGGGGGDSNETDDDKS